jgi:Trypsin-like peptidase domain
MEQRDGSVAVKRSTPPHSGTARVLEPVDRLLTLRLTDQETARVVALHRPDGEIVGSGCLVNNSVILTCRHVVDATLFPKESDEGSSVLATLAGVTNQPTVETHVRRLTRGAVLDDLALLEIDNEPKLHIPEAIFASPLRHGGKSYSVLGFPGGDQQGRNASGVLHAADASGLVQMDRGGALSVLGGFSGAPVWSSDLGAFVGIVVRELVDDDVSWCIPSRQLCEFYPELGVRFRIPPGDRPVIRDYSQDDPNVELFGIVSDNGDRRLTGVVIGESEDYEIHVRYECVAGRTPPAGRFVTFITYPDYELEDQDGYELFVELKPTEDGLGWFAEQELESEDLFTVAAVGDGGGSALTLDLAKLPISEKGKKR